MLETKSTKSKRHAKIFALLLGGFTILALVVTAWDLYTVRREQEIVADLFDHLQGEDKQVAQELANQLRLQWRLTASLVLSVLAAAIAFSLALRGYFSSERNLENARILSTDILASLDSAVMTTDMDGRILSVNPLAVTLFALDSHPELETIEQLAPGHALLVTIADEIRKSKTPIRDLDYRFQRDGHRRILRAGCTLLLNRDKLEIGMVFQIRDITERALIEERLRRMERYMALGTLAAGLQHEIKNPLNALTLHIQLLCERLQSEHKDDDVNETLDVLNTEVNRISNVLDGFRSYASIHEIGRAAVDVPSLITKLFRLMRLDAEQKGIRLEFVCEPRTTGIIEADSTQLEQVFLNLAVNAMAAMPHGGTLRFDVSEQEDKLRIEVSDTGIGIPPEHHAQLFDPYFTTRHDGTGMGLAICDKLIRQHNGSIDFVSGPEGTVFTILLPMKV